MNGNSPTRTMMATPLQVATTVVAVVFLVVGVAGFIPGITTNYDQMQFAGHESTAELLGIFQVSVLHNIVHLLFGVAGLAMAMSRAAARAYLIGGGAVYGVLFVYGLLVDKRSDANFVPLDRADDILHLVLAIGMIALGLVLSGSVGRKKLTS
jgi:hypothetical protein